MTRDFRGFFGNNPFDKESRSKMKEQWSKMTDAEKLEFMNKRMEGCENHGDHFSVEAIDARCQKWMNMTSEEKEEFVAERKKAFENRMSNFGGFFGHMHR